jgi:hypothetical protein
MRKGGPSRRCQTSSSVSNEVMCSTGGSAIVYNANRLLQVEHWPKMSIYDNQRYDNDYAP